jgi:hypothetical protein
VEVQVAGGVRILSGPEEGELIDPGRDDDHVDGVRPAAVRGRDRLAQGAVAVAGAVQGVGGLGHGEDRRLDGQRQEAEGRQDQADGSEHGSSSLGVRLLYDVTA